MDRSVSQPISFRDTVPRNILKFKQRRCYNPVCGLTEAAVSNAWSLLPSNCHWDAAPAPPQLLAEFYCQQVTGKTKFTTQPSILRKPWRPPST